MKVDPIVGWNAICVCFPKIELVIEQLMGDVESASAILVCGLR